MRTKIALIVVLASFLAAAALGAGMAGADPRGRKRSGRTVRDDDHDRGPFARRRRPAPTASTTTATAWSTWPTPTAPRPPAPARRRPPPSGASSAAPLRPPKPRPSAEPGQAGGVKQGSTIDGNDSGGEGRRRRHPQRKPRRLQRRRRIAAAGVAPPAPPAAATSRWAKATDGGSQFSAGGAPTTANPTTTIAPFGPAPIGVPNFVIDSFEIPPFLLPIYQACGTEYGIPWEVLASINKIETALRHQPQRLQRRRRRLDAVPALELGNVRARRQRRRPQGPLQPGRRDLRRGPLPQGRRRQHDLYDAILAYNHADWYAQEVLLYARAYGKLPSDLVGSLTGLTEGAHFPVAADARYADDISARAALQKSASRRPAASRRSDLLLADPARDQHLLPRRARRSSPSTTA